MKRTIIYTLLPCSLLLLLFSCGPVHRFTRVKKIPREYALNFSGSEIKAPRSDLNKEPWIVFSDREKNKTFLKPQGKVKAQDVDYLDPFLVIDKKGEYLKLIKYTPDVLKNGRLQHKKAEYCGWIHLSKLLLTRESYSDIATGKKHKTIVAFSDTLLLNMPDTHFGKDTLLTFKAPDTSSPHQGVPPFSLVYRLKESTNKEYSLIALQPHIKADKANEDILGWIDNSLLQDIGTGLHINFPRTVEDSVDFIIRNSGSSSRPTPDHYFENLLLSRQYPAARYHPISLYSKDKEWTSYRVGIPLPLFDKSENYIFNINGGRLNYNDFRKLSVNLKKINIAFVFEGGHKVIKEFSRLAGALQDLQSLFEEANSDYTYQFSCITGFPGTDGRVKQAVSTGMNVALQPEYSVIMNFLAKQADRHDLFRYLPMYRPWSALRVAVQSFDDHRDATNLIVVIGEKGVPMGNFDKDFREQIIRNNCRLLAFQPYAGNDNSYNNFVLNMESLITYYSDTMLTTKGDILVSPQQAKRTNNYRDISEEADNSYRLDFPDRSITQGYILFPSKGESLPMHILTSGVDTILQQIRTDNRQVLGHLSKAFKESGDNRTKYDSLFQDSYGMSRDTLPHKKTLTTFKASTPGWYLPSDLILLHDSVHAKMDYRLLVSEEEMKEIKEFVVALSKIEVDYKYQSQTKKKALEQPCNCPDDDIFFPGDETARPNPVDSIIPKYAGTRKIRKHIYNLHLDPLIYNKLCKTKKRNLKKMTLAELQERITGLPSFHSTLNATKVKNLKSKRKFSNRELDELVGYYKSMAVQLEKAEKIELNGQTWFWIGRKNLP